MGPFKCNVYSGQLTTDKLKTAIGHESPAYQLLRAGPSLKDARLPGSEKRGGAHLEDLL